MDISRPDLKKQKRRRVFAYLAAALIVLAIAAKYILHLAPAIPTLDQPVFFDVVKRGELVRQVRGQGTLVPREDRIRLIPAETAATVLRIRVLPGARVAPDTVVMDLVDPLLQQQLLDAQLQWKAAQADLKNVRSHLQSDLMTQRAGAATVSADQKQAQLKSQTDKSLYDLGVISGLSYAASKGKADELSQRDDLERQRITLNSQATETEMAVQQAKVDQAMAILDLKQKQAASLSVHAGIAGVLVDLPLQVGQHVDIGTTLAKVVQPDLLKASLKVPETQARGIQIGQAAEIDTHNGLVAGKVKRIDPAVVNGTVTVDIGLAGDLPQGARPDLSVDGTIDLDRLEDVLYIGRPAIGDENSTLTLFRIDPSGKIATRVQVRVGRASVNSMEVLSGLNAGDTAILSDMSRWEAFDKVHIQQ